MTAAAWICVPKIRPPTREARAKFWASVFFSHQRVCVCGHRVGNTSTRPRSRSAVWKQATGSNMFKSSPLNWRSDSWDHKSLLTYSNYLPDWRNTVSDGEVRSPSAFLSAAGKQTFTYTWTQTRWVSTCDFITVGITQANTRLFWCSTDPVRGGKSHVLEL